MRGEGHTEHTERETLKEITLTLAWSYGKEYKLAFEPIH